MSNNFFIIALFIITNLNAQFISSNDKEVQSNYQEAQFYSKDTLISFLKIKMNANIYYIKKNDSLKPIIFYNQKKDKIDSLKMSTNKNCVLRLMGFSFFEYQDSLSEINKLLIQLIIENPQIKSLVITGKHIKHKNSKVKYDFSALNPAYLKKWLKPYTGNVKVFALNENEKDFPEIEKINYVDFILIFN